jgi:hypothetical protein
MSTSDQLCDLLNEFYQDITHNLAGSVFSAIKAAQINEEFPHIFYPLNRLILNISNPQQDDSVSVNLYMSDPVTRGSSTRQFFYDMTLTQNFYPEDFISQPITQPSHSFPSLPFFPTLPSSLPSIGSSLPSLPSSFPSISSSFSALPSTLPSIGSSFPSLPSTLPSIGSSFSALPSSSTEDIITSGGFLSDPYFSHMPHMNHVVEDILVEDIEYFYEN